MSRVALSEVLNLQTLPDPYMSDNWELSLPMISQLALSNFTSADQALRIQCKSISLPGVTNEVQEVLLHGYKVAFAGKTTFPGTLSITFTERRDLMIYMFLQSWVNLARDHKFQTSKGKNIYALKTASLTCFNELGAPSRLITLQGLWCNEVPDVSLDNSSAALVDISATFRYDTFDIT
jgi:hypothetical protein